MLVIDQKFNKFDKNQTLLSFVKTKQDEFTTDTNFCQKRHKKKATPRFELGIKALQASALPLGHVALKKAEDETRTRDSLLGRQILYQLSYFRIHQ